MNIYYELSRDHRYFEQLLDRLNACSEAQDAQRKIVLEELCAQLIAHAHAEEAVLHVALRAGITRGLLSAHVLGEHATVRAEARDVELDNLTAETRTRLVEKLSMHLRGHIREEELSIYKAARAVFSEAEAVQLGDAFHRIKQHVLQGAEVRGWVSHAVWTPCSLYDQSSMAR